ncbi:GFA family protein [Maricaulis sp.]|uniref:GFA family protein n=1 Tax=Maricaulis sp. TaxID=1486257 RepID=UPI0026318C11|nr:GFA family protein [Maricaulis sp.]
MKLPLRGGCQCGAIRFEITKKPLTLYCNHSLDSQQETSSAFSMSLLVPRDGFKYLKGGPKTFEIKNETGKAKKSALFCEKCGTRIAHDTEGNPSISVKAGSLDDRANLKPVGHIWVKHAQGWTVFHEDELIYEEAPDDGYFALMERWAAQEHA